ncbi:MAG: serine/threonine-protein kinase, partial [Myxococcota bacterium]
SQRHTVQVFAKGSYQPNPRHRPQPYMVMELLKGESLEAYIARRGCLSVGETLDILAPVLDALYWAHSAGIVHRDLKPSNVFILNESGQPKPAVKLLDFGLAKATVAWDDTNREDVTVVGALSGTPAYMPPEQFLGLDQTTPASDIYAIGCIAYHMLTGQPPFEESGTFKLFNAHLFTPPPPLDGPLASHPIEPILHKAMAKKAHHRFSDVLELLQAILDLRTASDEDTLAAKALADPYPLHRPIASTHNHITSNEHPIHHTTSSNTLHRPKTPHRWIQLLSGWALRTLGTRSTPHRP